MKSKIPLLILFITLLLLSSTCFSLDATQDADTIIVMGHIQHLSYEGGFYGIVGDDGTQYKPLQLSDSYQIENLRVKAILRPLEKKLLTHGWGVPVEIVDIERIQ